ncbi:hypothetical protein EV132_103618 [Rhizobium sullae]|uniref:Uncharacterized protein n=1 Tax=Rhizobium sullae TaxID=50338 RepID=A0A4R3QAI3_RHISU|nr:hypothetical protein EV132_103618 [Rhizobium sullae]
MRVGILGEERRRRWADEKNPDIVMSVGAFPDGQSCLNLAAARLRHIAASQWSTRKYIAVRP